MNPADEFWTGLESWLADGSCLKMTLSKRIASAVDMPEKMTVRPTTVRGSLIFQWAARKDNRESHENLSADRTAKRIRELLGTSYEQAHVFTKNADLDVRASQEGRLTVRRTKPTRFQSALEHNRMKAHVIPENTPCPFLTEIGVMTPSGKVRASKTAKFRQINRFLELVGDVLNNLRPTGVLRVVDFGCGKSYLTFALYHLLAEVHKRKVNILGVDRRRDVVTTCSRLSETLGCNGLEFRTGEIADQKIEGPVDLAVSLHACDTATDDALAQAVAWQSSVILAVPCCQHELARTIHDAELLALHRHGILHEQFASLATDALRAQALEACGYRTQVVEFIDLEHTSKNLLIRAVRRAKGDPPDPAARTMYQEFKSALDLAEIATDRILAAGGA
jgi:hypothetical protein